MVAQAKVGAGSLPSVLVSADSVEWETPPKLFAALEARYGPFTLDPAATAANAKAPSYFTSAEDGLKQRWNQPEGLRQGRVWLNPPYGRGVTEPWVAKVIDELGKADGIESATLLLKADTDQPWFHDLVMRHAHEVIFLRGRVHFVGAPSGAPFRSMVVWFHHTQWARSGPLSRLPRFYAGLDDPTLAPIPLVPTSGES